MRDVRVSLRQPDHDIEQVTDRAAATAVRGGDPKRTKPGAPDQIDDVERQNALAITAFRPLGNVVEQQLQVRRVWGERLRKFERECRYGLVHDAGILPCGDEWLG